MEQACPVLGVDPTHSQAMGWGLARAGELLDSGQVKYPAGLTFTDEARRDYMAAALAALIVQHQPAVVAIEEPIVNSKRLEAQLERLGGDGSPLAAAYGPAPRAGRVLASTVHDTLRLALMAGTLERTARATGCATILVNPAEVKHEATGSIVADKRAVREAARFLLASTSGRPLSEIKLPPEHQADAIYITLAGWRLYRARELYRLAG